MLKHKKKMIVLVVIILIAGIIVAKKAFQNNNPVEIIETTFHMKLPSTAKIINFDCFKSGKEFNAKVQINEENIENVKKSLLDYFGYEESLENKEDRIYNFNNTISWWDMNKRNVVNYYFDFIPRKNRLFFSSPTIEIWAFIAKQDDGLFYLYIVYG